MKLLALTLAAVVGCALCLAPVSARADDATEADLRFQRGRELYRGGKVRDALEQFYVSNRLSPNPSVALAIARCLEVLGKLEEAYGAYTEHLAHPLPPEQRAEAEQALRALRPRVAILRVSSAPPGAAVYLDRENLGRYGVTPRIFAAAAGTHEVLLELEGHHPARASVELALGREVSLHLELAPLTGRIRVDTRPSGAEIRTDGAQGAILGTTPIELELPVGTRRLHLSREGYESAQLPIVVNAGETQTAELTLLRRAPPLGRLRLVTNVAAALVMIDRREAGFTPLVVELTQGRHEIRVDKPDHEPWSGAVEVLPDRLVAAEVTLEPLRQTVETSPWPWILLSGSVATGATFGTLGALAIDKRADFERAPSPALRAETVRLNWMADAALVVTVAAALGAGWFWLAEDAPRRSSRASIAGDQDWSGPR